MSNGLVRGSLTEVFEHLRSDSVFSVDSGSYRLLRLGDGTVITSFLYDDIIPGLAWVLPGESGIVAEDDRSGEERLDGFFVHDFCRGDNPFPDGWTPYDGVVSSAFVPVDSLVCKEGEGPVGPEGMASGHYLVWAPDGAVGFAYAVDGGPSDECRETGGAWRLSGEGGEAFLWDPYSRRLTGVSGEPLCELGEHDYATLVDYYAREDKEDGA